MSITKASAIRNGFHAHILEKLGIEPPQTSEDAYQIWLTLRSVVNFWRWKLDQLKTQSNEYEKLMEKNLNA